MNIRRLITDKMQEIYKDFHIQMLKKNRFERAGQIEPMWI